MTAIVKNSYSKHAKYKCAKEFKTERNKIKSDPTY